MRWRKKKEMLELNIFTIRTELDETYYPVQGWAKWFADDNGIWWVKFEKAADQTRPPQNVCTVCVPAAIVIEVCYRAKPVPRQVEFTLPKKE